MNAKTKRLKAIMKDHDLSVEQVATMTERSATTVKIWKCKHPARVIPDHLLQLLELKVARKRIPAGLAAVVESQTKKYCAPS